MNGSLKLLAPLVAALAVAACNAGGSSNVPATTVGASQTGAAAVTHHIPEWQAKHLARRVCPEKVGKPACQVLLATGVQPLCTPSNGSCGWTPSELETAYDLTPSLGKGSGTIVAVVEAGDAPNAISDVQAYRSEFGLGTANIYKYNDQGQQYNYPPSCEDYGWCLETDLDIEMVSAACPECTIYLMEGDGTVSGLEHANSEAVALGATIVSNSWSCIEDWDCEDTSFPSYFDTAGIAYLASTGDDGYNTIGGPSALGTVIGVGGTQLHKSGSTYSETVWVDASAGCADSQVVGNPGVAKPSWQTDPDCAHNRTDGDVSAESGCQPPVAEYITDGGYSGWVGVCGTSVASPFTGGVIALAGNATSLTAGETFWDFNKKNHKKDFNHTTSGDDGSCGDYLCAEGKKFDKYYTGPTGWGSPNGITAY